VYLIGAGPGDPDLLTVKAARVLAAVDVVLHDDLVTPSVLALVHPGARVINVGKRCGSKSITQAEIHDLMIRYTQQGYSVARLKSGDPLVFGRAAEEISALRLAGIECGIVPGITAAFAAAAALGCSFTDRRAASAILFLSGHHATANKEPADPTRVVYMPGRDFSSLAEEWLAAGLPRDLPCAVISRAAQPDQQVLRVTLETLAQTMPGPAPVLLIAGRVLDVAAMVEESCD
jgi:uroporphyrin-III C-methyltransferase